MSKHVMVLDKVKNKKSSCTSSSSTSSVQVHESSWLGHWTRSSNQVDHLHGGSKDFISPQDNNVQVNHEVLPFPMFKVSHKRDHNTTKPPFDEELGSSSKAMVNNTMPWMYGQGGDKGRFNLDLPVQEKTTQNLLELIRPVRIYATVDSINLPEDNGLLKGSTVSMKLKGKIFGGYLDLFPNIDHKHKVGGGGGGGGVMLQSIESSKDIEEGPKKNESSAETEEMDRLQMKHFSGISIVTLKTHGKGKKCDLAIPRTEIPDMNEEPPLVLDVDDSVDRETSNSATQSMTADHFLSRQCKRVRSEPEVEPTSRWVKRLKTNSNDTVEEASQGGQKVNNNNNLFLEILKSGINNNLQPRNQEPVTSQTKNLNQGGGGVEEEEEEEEITLLHPWIQRWCKKKDTPTNQQEGQEDVSFETENQKEFEKKHYPSIAAMALMGKALSGLNRYSHQKTESLMVWNAQDLR
ncbi:unnamed protein product [Cochlearia groenlandica]